VIGIGISISIAFLIGAIPTAYLAGIYFKKVDIRTQGSGNVGATNAFRVLGRKIGIFVFIIDFLKGGIPTLILGPLLYPTLTQPDLNLLVGSAAILGHIFTPFLSFKGGKGVATGAGVLCASFPMLFLVSMVVWVIIFSVSKTVSIASICSLASLLILSNLYQLSLRAQLAFLALFILILWTHRSNVLRLLRGNESKF